jgi:hypothetical protein
MHAEDLLDTWPYLTRMYTTISPNEMMEDPIFHVNPRPAGRAAAADGAELRAVQRRQRGDAAGRARGLRAGRVPWPDIPGEEWWEEEVQTIALKGAPMTLVNNTAAINKVLGEWNLGLGVDLGDLLLDAVEHEGHRRRDIDHEHDVELTLAVEGRVVAAVRRGDRGEARRRRRGPRRAVGDVAVGAGRRRRRGSGGATTSCGHGLVAGPAAGAHASIGPRGRDLGSLRSTRGSSMPMRDEQVEAAAAPRGAVAAADLGEHVAAAGTPPGTPSTPPANRRGRLPC